jgi:hypothetical protein
VYAGFGSYKTKHCLPPMNTDTRLIRHFLYTER